MTSRCALLAPFLLTALCSGAVDASTGSAVSYYQHLRTASFGSGIGATGIYPADVDNDGVPELVLSGQVELPRATFWSIASFNAQSGGYEIRWQSPRYLADSGARASRQARAA
jgi:hypothetical protein